MAATTGLRLAPSAVTEYSTLGGNFGVNLAVDNAVLLHLAQLLRQHFLRYPVDRTQQTGKPLTP